MYGNNFRPFILPRNMSYTPYNIPPEISRPMINTGTIRNLFRGVHNINWNSILNNTSRTLNVVKDAIPVIKEVRPMINNMKSMIKIASVFKDETDTKKQTNTSSNKLKQEENSTKDTIPNNNYNNYNKPNFFL